MRANPPFGTIGTQSARLSASLLIVMSLLTCAGGIAFGDDRSLIDRVRLEYPQALVKLEDIFSTMRGNGTVIEKAKESGSDEKTLHWDVEFAKRGDMALVCRTWNAKQLSENQAVIKDVYCKNPSRYVFNLSSSIENPNLSVINLGHNVEDFNIHYEIYVKRHAEAAYCVFGLPVRRMMEDASFKITKVSSRVEGDRELLRIDYDYHPKDLILRSGWLEVCPSDRWRIQEYETQLSAEMKGRTIKGVVEYQKDQKTGENLPVRSKIDMTDGIIAFDFQTFSLTPAPEEEEFTLAAFGFPDVEPSGAEGTSNLLGFVGAGVLLLVVAAILKVLASRAQQRRPRAGES